MKALFPTLLVLLALTPLRATAGCFEYFSANDLVTKNSARSAEEIAWSKLTLEAQLGARLASITQRDSGDKIERRIKLMTSGLRENATRDMDPADIKIDSADPSLVMPIHYPNGVTKYRINFSGLRFIEVANPTEFYRGGIFTVKRSRGFYADGTEMTGPYHNASWPWDVVIYQNAKGKQIAFGGVMQQPAKGELPNVARDNWTRSRWWGEVKHVEVTPGVFEEHIIWQGPVHDFNRAPHSGWVFHGYGGTLLTRFNAKTNLHEPIKLKNGNYLLFYERVSEEKKFADGHTVPYVTTMFVREMDPSLTTTVGREVQVTSMKSAKGEYLKALKRGTEEQDEGYLAEGGNVLAEKERGTWVKAWSANDYVRKYGIYLDYVPAKKSPKQMFTPVTDKNGELIDFAETMRLRELLHATWVGRPQLEYAPDGKLWMRFHFVPIGSIPKGAPVEGWPSSQEFLEYGRVTAQAPVKIVYDKRGRPNLELDIDPEFSFMFR